jgi:NAD(P)-dependent dehydrogenase (short-subunit alcohol dehydrogenase family)
MAIEVNLEGKIALVTGASYGLGARFSRVLAEAGARVVLASRNTSMLKELRAEIEAEGGAACIISLDATDHDSIRSAIEQIETDIGPIDILINNSGILSSQWLDEVSFDEYIFVMSHNQRGTFFVAQEVAKRMIERAKTMPGRQHSIINIASVAGMRPLPRFGLYGMSNAALIHMTKAMALEWGQHGINVNAICPGYIETEINAHQFDSELGRKLIERLPRKRAGKPEYLDNLLLLLAAEESGFINGAVIPADDGISVQ